MALLEMAWIGFAHKKFPVAQAGVQFQFGIDRDGVWSNGIWIQYDSRERKRAQQQLWANLDDFRRALKKLPPGYILELWYPHEDRAFKRWSVKADEASLEDFLRQVRDRKVHVHVGLNLSREKAIRLQENLPRTIARNFNTLLPLYSLMISESPGEEKPRPLPLLNEEDLLDALQTTRGKGRGQGFRVSPEIRKAIEHHAMHEAKNHFRTLGYSVRDVSRNHPFDLLCRKKKELHVEVKGTKTAGEKIILTRNEVEHARDPRRNMALFVLRRVKVSEKKGRTVASGGDQDIEAPWRIDEALLEPIVFDYKLVRKRKVRGNSSRR